MCSVLQIPTSTFDDEKKEQGLASTYTIAQDKPHQATCKEAVTANVRTREFAQTAPKRFIVSDLTYVRVQNRGSYICIWVDRFTLEGIGSRAGPPKDASLISRAFAMVKGDLRKIQWFHTDRGSECNHQKMDELLQTCKIGRSLSRKGCPYDNAVAEATDKIMKTEFVNPIKF